MASSRYRWGTPLTLDKLINNVKKFTHQKIRKEYTAATRAELDRRPNMLAFTKVAILKELSHDKSPFKNLSDEAKDKVAHDLSYEIRRYAAAGIKDYNSKYLRMRRNGFALYSSKPKGDTSSKEPNNYQVIKRFVAKHIKAPARKTGSANLKKFLFGHTENISPQNKFIHLGHLAGAEIYQIAGVSRKEAIDF